MMGSNQSTGRAASWDADIPDASDDHLPEPNAEVDSYVGSKNPTINGVPAQPVKGFRGFSDFLVRRGIPLLPLGPSKVARMGQGMNQSGRVPGQIAPVGQLVPAPSAEQAGDWYTNLGTDYLK